MASRREFLKNCCALGAAGAAFNFTRFGLMTANAQTASDYRALVCIFLFGGNDSNNTIVPTSTAGYSAYQKMRSNIALPQNTLLPISAQNASYGLHPRMLNVQRLYNAKQAAAIFNVGTLVKPTPKNVFQSGQAVLPKNLYSHSDQQSEWQTGSLLQPGTTGWGGRVNDLVAPSTPFPPGISVAGGSALLAGAITRAVSISPGSTFGLNTFGDQTAMDARFAALQQVLTFDSGVQLISSTSGVLTNAVKAAQEINKALAGGKALTTVFPNTGLGQQLAQVAKIIQVRGALGLNRQIFFASIGGFDNHSNLLADQDNLLNQLDMAVGAFQSALGELQVDKNVITFTESDFNRTGQPSANAGSDHAWGGHHFVIGAPVKGGDAFGTFPTLALQGPDDTGDRGVFIPTTSLDQYAATLGSWFGVSDNDLPTVFPNLNNFPANAAGNRKLGFL